MLPQTSNRSTPTIGKCKYVVYSSKYKSSLSMKSFLNPKPISEKEKIEFFIKIELQPTEKCGWTWVAIEENYTKQQRWIQFSSTMVVFPTSPANKWSRIKSSMLLSMPKVIIWSEEYWDEEEGGRGICLAVLVDGGGVSLRSIQYGQWEWWPNVSREMYFAGEDNRKWRKAKEMVLKSDYSECYLRNLHIAPCN